MNEENFHKNVDDIEFKCKALISEINEHLSLYCTINDNINWRYATCKTTVQENIQQNNDDQLIQNASIMTSCHNKLLNFTNQRNKNSTNFDILKIHVPKQLCCNITKINQIIAEELTTKQNDDETADKLNLKVQHLIPVNIQPKLTKQVVFQIACPNTNRSITSNIGTFSFRHQQNQVNEHSLGDADYQKITHFSDKNVQIFKNDKMRNFNDESNEDLGRIGEENDKTDNEKNHIRHFLFGDVIEGNSMIDIKNHRKMYRNKIKMKNGSSINKR